MRKYLLFFIVIIWGSIILVADESRKESVKENRDIIKRCVILSENLEENAIKAEKRKDSELAAAYRKYAKTKRNISKALLSGKKLASSAMEIKNDEKALAALDNLLKKRSLKEIPKERERDGQE